MRNQNRGGYFNQLLRQNYLVAVHPPASLAAPVQGKMDVIAVALHNSYQCYGHHGQSITLRHVALSKSRWLLAAWQMMYHSMA